MHKIIFIDKIFINVERPSFYGLSSFFPPFCYERTSPLLVATDALVVFVLQISTLSLGCSSPIQSALTLPLRTGPICFVRLRATHFVVQFFHSERFFLSPTPMLSRLSLHPFRVLTNSNSVDSCSRLNHANPCTKKEC